VENHRRTLKKTLIFGGIKVAFSHPSGLTENFKGCTFAKGPDTPLNFKGCAFAHTNLLSIYGKLLLCQEDAINIGGLTKMGGTIQTFQKPSSEKHSKVSAA
jgi:hypothetical protein